MLGMKRRSLVQGFPTQKGQSEDYAQHLRSYNSRRYGRIYATLNDRQAEYQSNMIEVEGKIINKPISILIDSREIHFYIDPKIVDRLHLEKIKLGKTSLA